MGIHSTAQLFSGCHLANKERQETLLQLQLHLQLDQFDLLSSHGCLQRTELEYDVKFPILLPRRQHFTELVIRDAHDKLFHAGVSHTCSRIRQTYWIPQGRAEVRRVTTHCTICRRHEGEPFSLPEMPPLPMEKVSRSTPFKNTGLDYLGPIVINEGQQTTKVWVCLFTCLATRAIIWSELLIYQQENS